MLEEISNFCALTHINVSDKELEAQFQEWKANGKSFEDIISELVPMIQEQVLTFSQKLLKKKEEEQREQTRTNFIDEQTKKLDELRQTKEKLEQELNKITHQISSIQRDIHIAKNDWKRKQEIPPHMEVKQCLVEWEKQGKPTTMEYAMSSEAIAIIKDMNIKITKPSQRGKQISVEFAEFPRPQQEPHHNSDDFDESEQLYLIPKSEKPEELSEPQRKITEKIHENLRKKSCFQSVIRGPFVTPTVDALPFPVYGVIVIRSNKGVLTSMSPETFAKKQEKSPFPILNCCVMSYSSDTINEFVINLKANQIPDKTYWLIEENLTIQKRD
jgi:hypothetical protein